MPALPEVLKLPVPEIFAAFVVSVVALAASPVTRAAGTIPAARLPLISTFHNVAPAAFLNSKKFPVGKVSVTRCDNSAVFPFADWLIVTPVSVGDALNTALLLPVSSESRAIKSADEEIAPTATVEVPQVNVPEEVE